MYIDTNILSILSRRGQVLPAAAVHGQALPARARPDHRRRVRRAHDQHRGQADQAADLGHGRAGGVQVHHQELLPRGRRGAPRLRHHPQVSRRSSRRVIDKQKSPLRSYDFLLGR